ncbi:MAG: ADP-forming succinate--CoA ligase subunit beta [Alphaproteobacteria bacterium]
MNIHEYQAKKLLSSYGINVPRGMVAYTPLEAKRVANIVSVRGPWMLKSQIQSGSRNHGHFLEKDAGKKGGIRKIKSKKEILENAKQMLGSTLVTSQTGAKGKLVSKIYIEHFVKVSKIFYFAVAIDRSLAKLTMLIAHSGDTPITEILKNDAKKILRIHLGLKDAVDSEQIYSILNYLKLDEKCYKGFESFINNITRFFLEKDASMLEINPLGLQNNNSLIALDAKMSFDDNAMYRQADVKILQDDYEEDERSLDAAKYGFGYGQFNEGSVGCIVNGDGLALSVMDLLKSKGYSATCFLNVKGGVDKDKIASGIKVIVTNPRVEGIFINILGGFVRCDLIAEGIVSAASEVGLNVPLVVRFEGTNKDEAIETLRLSGLPITIANSEEDGASRLISAMEEIT